jgi:hypothetical protein
VEVRMAHGLFQLIQGREGEIVIERLGSPIGTIRNWTLSAQGDVESMNGLYDLKADLSYIMPVLFNDPDYEKTITLRVSRQKRYRLELAPDGVTRLEGRSLSMKGVRLVKAAA